MTWSASRARYIGSMVASNGCVVVVGASGFVGRHLCAALLSAGYEVRGTCRDPEKLDAADRAVSGMHWTALDLDHPRGLGDALKDCSSAYFLVHSVGSDSRYAEKEAVAAHHFAEAAEAAGLDRIIYLGGVTPKGPSSRHLQSRANTGRILRAGQVPTLELRAAMIIGPQSISWIIVRDLAARLPVMVLPKWLGNHSWPVDIDDVVFGLVGALKLRREHSVWELPGPERLSHRGCLERTARVLGRNTPMLRVPVVTPALSSYWIALVTRAQLSTTRELVEGLRYELEPVGEAIWSYLPEHQLVDFDTAARRALADEQALAVPSKSRLERLRALGEAFANG